MLLICFDLLYSYFPNDLFFQAITGIEDISISLATLEQFNWDIDVMPL